MANFTAFEDEHSFVFGIEYPVNNKYVNPDEWVEIDTVNQKSLLYEPQIVIPLDQVEQMDDTQLLEYVKGAMDRARFVLAKAIAVQLVKEGSAYTYVQKHGITASRGVVETLRQYGGESGEVATAADALESAITFIENESRRMSAMSSKRFGYIYVVESAGYHKIGRAKEVTRRVYQFSTEYPHPVELVMSAPAEDMHATESKLHRHFSHKRVRGEWFNLDKDDLAEIREMLGING